MNLKKFLSPLLAIATLATFLTVVNDAGASPGRGRGHAYGRQVPELSVGAAGGALALVAGGLMVMFGRRRRDRG